MRNLLLTLSIALFVAAPARADFLSFCRGLVGLAARRPPEPATRASASTHDPNAAPASDSFERISTDTDAFGKVFVARPRTENPHPFETGRIFQFLRRHSAFARTAGFQLTKDGNISYADPNGINKRLDALPAETAPAVRFHDDVSPGVTEVIPLAKLWVEGKAAISRNGVENGRSLHYHDLFVHGIGYLLLPKSIVDKSRRRMKYLVDLYEHPVLSRNNVFRAEVLAEIAKEITALDSASNQITNELLEGRSSDNLLLLLNRMAVGSESPEALCRQRKVQDALTRPQKRALDAFIAANRFDTLGARAVGDEITVLLRRFP